MNMNVASTQNCSKLAGKVKVKPAGDALAFPTVANRI